MFLELNIGRTEVILKGSAQQDNDHEASQSRLVDNSIFVPETIISNLVPGSKGQFG